jgi:hypothetical protein
MDIYLKNKIHLLWKNNYSINNDESSNKLNLNTP